MDTVDDLVAVVAEMAGGGQLADVVRDLDLTARAVAR
jgi:hypothetical protein